MAVRDQSWHSDSRLVGYWPLADNIGTTQVLDVKGGNHGTATANTNTLSANGPFGDNSGLNFNGTNNNVTANIAGFRSADSSGTFMCWAKPTSLKTDNEFFYSGDATNGLGFYFRQGRPYMQFRVSGSWVIPYVNVVFPPGRWYHIAMGSTGSSYFCYIDGVAKSISMEGGGNNGDWFHDVWPSTYIGIGAARWGGYWQNFFTGSLSDVRIYNAALSANEIFAQFAAGIRRQY